jgi:hypothetical protein
LLEQLQLNEQLVAAVITNPNDELEHRRKQHRLKYIKIANAADHADLIRRAKKHCEKRGYKIFKNTDHYLGIIFDEEEIEGFVKEAKKVKEKMHVYIFSLDDSVPEGEFKELKGRIKLCAIPEAILHVYRRIFKDD